VGRASCSTSTSTARRAPLRPGPGLRLRRPAPGLLHRRPAGERRPGGGPTYDGAGTSTTSRCAPRTWTACGSRPGPTWSST
jgi:hypothetical protein